MCHNWNKPFGIRGLEPTSFPVSSPTCPPERDPGDEFWTGAMISDKEKKYSIPQSLSQIHPWRGAKGTRMSHSLISSEIKIYLQASFNILSLGLHRIFNRQKSYIEKCHSSYSFNAKISNYKNSMKEKYVSSHEREFEHFCNY